jgi:hypothetical protein
VTATIRWTSRGAITGLEGVLEAARSGSQFDMSLCLHVVEAAGSTHPMIHTLDLYAPHVQTAY